MNWAQIFYMVGVIFFILFSLLVIFFLVVGISTYLKIKKTLRGLADTKFLFSTFKSALEQPSKMLLPLVGFIAAFYLKLKKQKKIL